MDFMEKVNDLVKKAGDKANELVEVGKLNLKVSTENSEVEALQKKIGEICFGKYRSGDELDPEIENLCAQIEKHKRIIAETQRTLHKMKAASGDTVDMASMGYCPYCGAELVKDAAFCAGCGQKIR